MATTGIDGGIDGGSAVAVTPLPPAPPPAARASAFAALVEITDRTVQDHLDGVPVLYTSAGGSPAVWITGMFSEPFELAQGEPFAGVETLGPSVFVRLEDLPTDPEIDDPILTIGGVAYRVAGPREPDGIGGIVLRLRKAG